MSGKSRFVKMAIANGGMKKDKNGKLVVVNQSKIDQIKSRFGLWKAASKKKKAKKRK
jgi:hypothetical protein